MKAESLDDLPPSDVANADNFFYDTDIDSDIPDNPGKRESLRLDLRNEETVIIAPTVLPVRSSILFSALSLLYPRKITLR
jgi:hypothetical protein